MANEFGDEEIQQVATNEFGDVAIEEIANVPRGTIPEAPTFSEDRFTPSQRAALSALGPLGATLAALSGTPVTQTEAAAEGALEEIGRLPGRLGGMALRAFAPAPLRLIAPSALETAIQQIEQPFIQAPETIETALGVPPTSERAFFRAPGAGAGGEIFGGLFPPVGLVPREAAVAARAVSEGLQALTPSLPGKMAARGVSTPTFEKATGLLRGVEEGKLTEILSQAPPRITEASGGKLAKTGKETIAAAKKAETIAFDEALGSLKSAEEGGFAMKGDFIRARGRAELLNRFESLSDQPQVVEDILSKPVFLQLAGDVPPVKGQRLLRELNTEWERQVDKLSPEAIAYKTIRDELAGQLDDIVKLSSGKNVSPYRDWGNIREFRNGIENRLEAARQAAGAEAVPVTPESAIGVGTTLRGQVIGAAARRLARMTRPLIKQGQEFVDEAVEAVIKDSPKKVSRENLSEETLIDLRSRYLKSPPKIQEVAPSVSPPPLPPPTYEEQIAITIQNLPADIQGLPQAAKEQIARQLIEGSVSNRPRALTGETINRPTAATQAIAETVQPAPRASSASIARSPDPVPVKTYPPEVQSVLDARKAQYDADVQRIKTSQWDSDVKGRRLKAEGMRYAADKRQITGELTAKEFQTQQAREASNYIGKPVSVNLGGETVSAQVVGNPFGRVTVKLSDGREITVLPENIGGPIVSPVSPLQQAISEAAQSPLGSINDPLPGDLIPSQILSASDAQLVDAINEALRQGDVATARNLESIIRGRR